MNWSEFIEMNIPEPVTVTVEALTGTGGHGDLFAAPLEVSPCVVDESRRMVRVASQDAAGKELVSSATVWMPPGTLCPAGSKVTYNSRRAKVIASSNLVAFGLDLPEHVEVSLE